ncbi:MAG: DUF1573 domain-containing protein [Gemmataceae bacterium]|nr:DUF1573 domain-containing protein [Gemmataceae bacterium]MCI0741420.1 DUF1573 domain-containing protein [Gemmataceae bacterium]
MSKAALTLGCLFWFCQAVSAELRFFEPIAELGEIRGGIPLRHAFTFVNAGATPLEIVEVNRGCGCVSPRLEKRRLAPREKGTLTFDLRTLGQKDGPHAWKATVRYRQDNVTRDVSVSMLATVKNEVTVQPAVLAFFVEKTLRQEVTLTDTRTTPLLVRAVESTSKGLVVQTKPLTGGVTKIILEANAVDLTPGRHDELLSIYTDDPEYALLQIPLTLTRLSAAPVQAVPQRVELRGQNATQLVRLRPRGTEAVVVDKIEVDHPAIVCTWAAGPGSSATVRVRVETGRALGKTLESFVRVQMSQPMGGVVIPVQWTE